MDIVRENREEKSHNSSSVAGLKSNPFQQRMKGYFREVIENELTSHRNCYKGETGIIHELLPKHLIFYSTRGKDRKEIRKYKKLWYKFRQTK